MDLDALKQVPPIGAHGTYYRLHSNARFERSPDRFYLNFVESRHTFESQYRFAGKRQRSGFYFGSTLEVVQCEELYFNMTALRVDTSAESFITALRAGGSDKVLLRVDIEHPGVCDFTTPWIVKHFLTKGHFRARQKYRPELALEWLNPILSEERGGNEYNDGLGTDAWEAGFAGIRFPSIRAVACGNRLGIDFNSPFGRQSLVDWARFQGSGAQETGQAQALERQLLVEHNVVLFSGSELTRNILRYSWNDGTGFVDLIKNPYRGVSKADLERVRLGERQARGISLQDAIVRGLLSEEEIEEAFEPEYLWIYGDDPARG